MTRAGGALGSTVSGGLDGVFRSVLPSGLRVLCTPMPHVHRTAVTIHVRSGSRFESPTLGGIAHFHEHMLHRGTRSHPSAHALALAFEQLGSELGAATYVDHTVLSAAAPPENLEQVLLVLSEVVSAPLFGSAEIERGIVREEILESLNEEGEPIDPDELLMALAFPDHGLGRPITGTLAALDRFDSEVLEEFHRSTYHGQNMVVSVAGPIEAERTAEYLDRVFSGLGSGQPPLDAAPAALAGPSFRYVEDAGSQTALRVAFRAPSENEPLEPAAELLLRTLDDGMSTRLYHQVCDERGLAYDVSASYEAFADTGLFTLAGEAGHAKIEQLLSAFFAIVQDLWSHGITEAELTKAKQRYAWQMRAMLDEPGELAAYLGLGELTGVARTPEERCSTLNAVALEAVHAAARAVFSGRNLAIAAVGQKSEKRRRALERLVSTFGLSAA